MGRRIALIPNPTKMVAITLAAMRREGDWENEAEDIVNETMVGYVRFFCMFWLFFRFEEL